MNPYQRIPGVQEGHIDTEKKFEQMVAGIDLNGLRVLDVGCNLGEMTRLAVARGAYAHGIDERRDYILDARKLTKGGRPGFNVQNGYRATGEWDLAFVSGCFHYFQDPARFLAQLARVAKRVRVDVWTDKGVEQVMVPTHRGLLIPSGGLFITLAEKHFGKVETLDRVESPDGSIRILFDLQKPKPIPPKSMLIYGKGGTGKTTMAKEMTVSGYEHLQLDSIFVEWRIISGRADWSVSDQTKTLKGGAWPAYLEHARNYVYSWLKSRRGLDVVIEGFEAVDEEYRGMILTELADLGWKETEEVAL